jgi:DNA-binding transcriptional LysR family regulator
LQGDVADMLARFLAKHSRVRIELDATNGRVDVIDEGLDIAMRVRIRWGCGSRHARVRARRHDPRR